MNQEKEKFQLRNWELVSVNPNNRNWEWSDYFNYWAVSTQSVIGFSLIASFYLLYDLNTIIVLLGCLTATFLIFIFTSLIGKASQSSGLPFPVILRLSMGFNGARYIGALRGFVGIFMFGIQTYFLSKVIGYMIRIIIFSIDNSFLEQEIFLTFLLGLNIIDWVSFSIVIIFQAMMFSVGIQFNKKLVNISAITVYLGMILFFFIVFLSDVKITTQAFTEILNFGNFLDINNLAPFLSVAGTIFAYFSIIIISFGDYTRYVKDEQNLKKGNLSLILNLIIFSFFAVFIVVGSDVFLNQKFGDIDRILTNPTDIIGKFDDLQITVVVLFFIIVASASTNLVANFIPSQYSLINFLPNTLTLKSASYIISIIGFLIGLFWLTVLSQIGILSFIDTFSSFFGPIIGLMIADYYLIKKCNLSNKDIYSEEIESIYYYSGGWHIKGAYSLLLGFIFSASTIWNSNLMFLQSYAFIIGVIVSFLTYYFLAKK